MSFGAIAIGAGVSAAGSIASSAISASAANRASRTRANALQSLQQLDIPELQNMARTADEERFRGSLDLQRRVDPQAAEARSQGLKGILDSLDTGNRADETSRSLLEGLLAEQELTAGDEQALKEKLLADAKAALDAGATLPPEFQAELVRTGLEKSAGVAGFRPEDRAGAAGTTVRRLIGSEGLKLQENRRLQAIDNIKAASGISSSRVTILGSIAQQFQALAQNQLNRSAAAANAGQSLLPSYGLSGSDVANLKQEDIRNRNAVTMGVANEAANRQITNGAMVSSILGTTTGAVGTGLSLGMLPGGFLRSTTGTPDNVNLQRSLMPGAT